LDKDFQRNLPHKAAEMPCRLICFPYLYQAASTTFFARISGSCLEPLYNESKSCSPRQGQDFGNFVPTGFPLDGSGIGPVWSHCRRLMIAMPDNSAYGSRYRSHCWEW